VRVWILYDLRCSIDAGVKDASRGTKEKEVNLYITLPNGVRATATTTTGIVQDCLLTEARPRSPGVHMAARTVCWLAFGVHAVTLGMACLTVQLFLVTLTLAFSVAMVQGRYADGHDSSETRIGGRLVIKQRNDGGAGSNASVFALLDLTEEEEETMVDWAIYPTRRNKVWWSTFKLFKEDAKRDRSVLRTWGARMGKAHTEASAGQ
jgi:hypothetical protein